MPGKGQLAFRSPPFFATARMSCADNGLQVACRRVTSSLAIALSRSEYVKVSHSEDDTTFSS
jgi:hypothetical protein